MQFFVIFFFAFAAVATAQQPGQPPESGVRFEKPVENRNDEASDPRGENESVQDPEDEAERREDKEPKRHSVQKRRACVPGSVFKRYCNTCTCHADGRESTCTQKRCGNGEFDKKTGQRPYVHYSLKMLAKRFAEPSRLENLVPPSDVSCEPGKSFKFYCNSCRCGNDGVPISCSSLHCARGVWNRDGSLANDVQGTELKWQNDELAAMQCEPNTSFSYYCNRCFCSGSAKVTHCSDMMCPPGLYNRDGSEAARNDDVELKHQEHADLAILRCEPGTNFKYYCNECRCSGSGIVAYCTNSQCSPGSYNRDGSRFVPVDGDSSRA